MGILADFFCVLQLREGLGRRHKMLWGDMCCESSTRLLSLGAMNPFQGELLLYRNTIQFFCGENHLSVFLGGDADAAMPPAPEARDDVSCGEEEGREEGREERTIKQVESR